MSARLRALALLVTTGVLSVAIVGGTPASAAQIGTLSFGPLTGQDQTFGTTTSGPCPASGTNLVVSITGGNIPNPNPADPPLIQGNLGGTSIAGGINTTAFTVPLAQTLAGFANGLGLSGGYLGAGTYTTTLVCRGKFDPTSVGEYVGQFTVTGSGASSVVTPIVPGVDADTTTVLTTTPAGTANPSTSVTLKATVDGVGTATNPVGVVQFKDGATLVGSAIAVVSSTGGTSIATTSLVPTTGAHTFTAEFTAGTGFNDSSGTANLNVVLSPPSLIGAPSLTGAIRVGGTAVCTTGTWSGATSYQYEFLKNGAVVQTSATDTNLVLAPADLGKSLSCRVTASGPGGTGTPSLTSASTVAAGAAAKAVSKPKILGKAKVGKKLKANRGTWAPSASYSYTYVWKRGSKVVKQGATATSYKLTKKDKKKKITLTVVVKRTGYATASATSAAVKVK